MPEAKAPLMAGMFTDIPRRVHDYGGGKFMFMNAANTGCWSDPEHRALLYSMEDVEKVAKIHGYELDGLNVVRRVSTPGATGVAGEDGKMNVAPGSPGDVLVMPKGYDTLLAAQDHPIGAMLQPTGGDDTLKGVPGTVPTDTIIAPPPAPGTPPGIVPLEEIVDSPKTKAKADAKAKAEADKAAADAKAAAATTKPVR